MMIRKTALLGDGGTPDGALQPLDEWVEVFGTEFIDSAKAGHDALFHSPVGVAVALQDLRRGIVLEHVQDFLVGGDDANG